ncbi:hypothetical protein GCM10011428_68960 [Streptomyces violaceus]
MDGVVAYVAPNDVVNKEDSAYDRFFARVGTKECRDRLNAVQREALVRREPLEKKYAAYAKENGLTFETIGSLDKAYEATVLDYVWGYWQYSLLKDCDQIPADAKNATDDDIWTSVDTISGFSAYADQGWRPTRRTTTRPGRSSARRRSSSRTSRSSTSATATSRRATSSRVTSHEVPAAGDAGRRHLGPAQRPPDALRQRARTTRGAPSRSASARARRTPTS